MPRGVYDRTRSTVETRPEDLRQERRMKPGVPGAIEGLKLAVDPSQLDEKTFVYRQVRSDRIGQRYRQDYDVAPEGKDAKPDSTGLGSAAEVHGGFDDDGAPHGMVLMRKRRDWYDEDQKRKQQPIVEAEKAIRRGADHKANELRGEGVYTPGGANTLEQAGNSLD